MTVSYNKLWKMLIDKGMIKKDLRLATGMTSNMMAKLGRNESVPVDTLVSVCRALNCDISDVMEILPETK